MITCLLVTRPHNPSSSNSNDITSRSSTSSTSSSSSSSSSSKRIQGIDLPWLLAYGNPRQSASLLASVAKMLRRAGQQGGDSGSVGHNAGCSSSSSCCELQDILAGGVVCMACWNLGTAFAWMEKPGVHPYDRARGAGYGSGVSRAGPSGAGGSGGAGGVSSGSAATWEGQGAAAAAAEAAAQGTVASASSPAGPGRLQLLLSFALAKVVPSLSAHLILQCRQLLSRGGAAGGADRADTCAGAYGDDGGGGGTRAVLCHSLTKLLVVMAVTMQQVWRCRALVRTAQQGAAGPGSSMNRNHPTTGAVAAAARVTELGALADGLQGLLHGEADMAGLVGAALDCLQLLPAAERGQLAATALELVLCCLRSCVHDMVVDTPLGHAVNWSAASPTVRQVVRGRQPEKLRAAAAAARAAGYQLSGTAGDTLAFITEGYMHGGMFPQEMFKNKHAPQVPLWLLGPGEVGRELGGSCCCNARCTRLEGDSEAGEGQGQGLLVCGRCRGAWYCCRDCQAADWAGGHKRACRGK